ncbi:hypothetical protein BN871_AG_00270 [Paenibacillus sp. P22]|nr:hypothetical protein BN871_AG_00270 [Paenibacillus sp. P22]
MLMVDDLAERLHPGEQKDDDEQNADPLEHKRQQMDHEGFTCFHGFEPDYTLKMHPVRRKARRCRF